MRASIIVAAHQEGDRLWRTVASCVESTVGLDHEIVIADDASVDGSVQEVERRFPQVRVFRHDNRRGAAPTKALGAKHARDDVLIFLDGHCKPEHGAIAQLVDDVLRRRGIARLLEVGHRAVEWTALPSVTIGDAKPHLGENAVSIVRAARSVTGEARVGQQFNPQCRNLW